MLLAIFFCEKIQIQYYNIVLLICVILDRQLQLYFDLRGLGLQLPVRGGAEEVVHEDARAVREGAGPREVRLLAVGHDGDGGAGQPETTLNISRP